MAIRYRNAGITLSEDAAIAAARNLELVEDAYGRGTVSIIELLDAQNAAILAEEGAANAVYDFLLDLMEVERAMKHVGVLRVGGRQVECVNATVNRSAIGHELAKRARFGDAFGCVYRIQGRQVHATLYSIGDFDVAQICAALGGGGHRNAAGFTVSLEDWLADFA